MGRRVAAWSHRHPRVRLGLILALPLAWLGVVYLGSLGLLFLNAFWKTDPFTSLVVRDFTLDGRKLIPVLHYDGTPITARFIAGDIAKKLDQLKVVPFEKAAS